MFFVKRPRAVPQVLRHPPVTKWRADAMKFFTTRDLKDRAQERFQFFSLDNNYDIRGDVVQLFHKKCAMCESQLVPDAWRIHRFRPPGGATGLTGRVSPDHYWWLAYEWQNLYPFCASCADAQGSRFPIRSKQRARVGGNLVRELPLLLDPCQQNHIPHLVFQFDGTVEPRSIEGRHTIETFHLNRTDLTRGRKTVATALKEAWHDLVDGKGNGPSISRTASHLAMRCSLLLRLFGELKSSSRPDLLAIVDDALTSVSYPATAAFDDARRPSGAPKKRAIALAGRAGLVRVPRRVEWVEIWNFKAIQHLRLELGPRTEGRNWLMLLGTNAAGKSTILQAIALALMGSSMREKLRKRIGLDAREWVHNQKGEATIRVKLTDLDDPYEVTLSSRRSTFSSPKGQERPARAFLLGYGSTRLVQQLRLRAWKIVSNTVNISNLFDPLMPLVDPERWLRTLDRERFSLIAQGLKNLVGMSQKDWLFMTRKNNRPRLMVRTLSSTQPLHSMSEGYLSLIGLGSAIMSFLMRVDHEGKVTPGWERTEDAEGIVLIDELETHLHPRWKLQIVSALKRAFPKIQFIVTTHDPLCLRGLGKNEIALVRRNEEARHDVEVVTDLPDPRGLRADQLLTSEYFGLGSTVDPELDRDMAEYYALLALPKRKRAQQQRLDALEAALDRLRQFGDTRRDRLMYQAIDRYLAVEPQIPQAAARKKQWLVTLREVRKLSREALS